MDKPMRYSIFSTFLLIISFIWGMVPAFAESSQTLASLLQLPPCAGLDTAQNTSLDPSPLSTLALTWDGEPINTAQRELFLVNMGQRAGQVLLFNLSSLRFFWQGRLEVFPAEGGLNTTGGLAFNPQNLKASDSYSWFAVFYDANGTPLCRSTNGWIQAELLPDQTAIVCGSNRLEDLLVGCSQNPLTPPTLTESTSVGCSPLIGDSQPNLLFCGDTDDLLVGLAGNDTLLGLGGRDTLQGGADHDYLEGGTGDDVLQGGAGNDTINGGANWDTFDEGNNTDAMTITMNGTAGTATSPSTGNDILTSIEQVITGLGDDTFTLNGLGGIDSSTSLVMNAGTGTNRFIFANGITGYWTVAGNGTETLDFTNIPIGIGNTTPFNLANTTTHQNPFGSFWLLLQTQIENVIGTNFSDSIVGNSANNQINGLNGNDTLNGAAGNDTLNGGSGSDWLAGGAGVDQFLDTGGLSDVYDAREATGNVSLTLGGSAVDDGFGNTEDLSSNIFEVVHGGSGNDTLNGNSVTNIIFGGSGCDVLDGAAGADMVFGGWFNPIGVDQDDTCGDYLSDSDDGVDTLYGGNQNLGGTGDDTGTDTFNLTGSSATTVYGGNYNSSLVCIGGNCDDRANTITTDTTAGTQAVYGGNHNQSGIGHDLGTDTLTVTQGISLVYGGNFNVNASSNGNDGNDSLVINTGTGQITGGNANLGGWGSDGNDTIQDNSALYNRLYGGNDNHSATCDDDLGVACADGADSISIITTVAGSLDAFGGNNNAGSNGADGNDVGIDTLELTSGSLSVFGGNRNSNNDSVGHDGNDVITVRDGTAQISGGNSNFGGRGLDGNDTIQDLSSGNNIVTGGNDNQSAACDDGTGVLCADGNDSIITNANTNTYGGNYNFANNADGNDGADTIQVNSGGGTVYGGNINNNGSTGNDSHDTIIDNSSGNNTLYGGNRNNSTTCMATICTDGSDTITDNAGADANIIYGGNQNVGVASGNDGNDVINTADADNTDTVSSGNSGTAATDGGASLDGDGVDFVSGSIFNSQTNR